MFWVRRRRLWLEHVQAVVGKFIFRRRSWKRGSKRRGASSPPRGYRTNHTVTPTFTTRDQSKSSNGRVEPINTSEVLGTGSRTTVEGPAQTRSCPFGEERPALNEHLPRVRLEDRDLIDRVVSLHDERRERVHVGQADPVRL